LRALIVGDADGLGTLAAVRGLGSAGWTVGIGSPKPGIAATSRWCARRHPLPAPQHSLEGFLTGVHRACAESGYEVVFGAGDAEVLALSSARDQLSAVVPHAPHDQVLRSFDKLRLYRAARAVGFRVPDTALVTKGVPEGLEYPVMVKPRLHWSPDHGGGRHSRVEAMLAPGRVELRRRVEEIRSGGGQALVQQVVRGPLAAYIALTDRGGSVLVDFQQVGDRVWPPGAGVFTRARTLAPSDEVRARAAALLCDLEWFGIVQIQFLVPEDGEPRLVDMNGRIYWSLALPHEAGANLVAMWAALATARGTPRAATVACGISYQWLEGDLRRAFAERRGGLVADVASALRYAKGAVHPLWNAHDPRPLLSHARRAPRRMLRTRAAPRTELAPLRRPR